MRMSIPLSRIQSGTAIHTSPSGRPEEKDSNETASVRREVTARTPAYASSSIGSPVIDPKASAVDRLRSPRQSLS